jgi:hypothetical protein
MLDRAFLNGRATRLERALAGRGTIDDTTAPLLGVAARLYAGATQPVPRPLNAARARLKMLGAVNEQATRAAGSHGAKVRGATLGAAAVAGAGLLMASAATNSNPVGVVRSTVFEFPAMVVGSSAPKATDVTLVGTIVSVDEGGRQVEIDTGETLVAVDVRDVPVVERAADAAAPVTVGSVVEVDGSLRDGDLTVRAREVTVKEPAAVAGLAPVDRDADSAALGAPTEAPSTKPALTANAEVGTNATPPTATATPTPRTNDTNDKPSLLAPATPRPTLTPTPTPWLTPMATETPLPTPIPPVTSPVLPDDEAIPSTENLDMEDDGDARSDDGLDGGATN